MLYLAYDALLSHDGVDDDNYCYRAYYIGNLITTNKHPYVVSGSLFQEIHLGGSRGMDHSIISWEPITMKDNGYKQLYLWLGKKSTSNPMPMDLYMYELIRSPWLE